MDFAHLAGAAERQGDDDEPAVDEDGAELLDAVHSRADPLRRLPDARVRPRRHPVHRGHARADGVGARLPARDQAPLKRCGKTRLQDVAGELVHRPLLTDQHHRPRLSARSTPTTRRRSCSTRPMPSSPPAAASAPKGPRTCAASSTLAMAATVRTSGGTPQRRPGDLRHVRDGDHRRDRRHARHDRGPRRCRIPASPSPRRARRRVPSPGLHPTAARTSRAAAGMGSSPPGHARRRPPRAAGRGPCRRRVGAARRGRRTPPTGTGQSGPCRLQGVRGAGDPDDATSGERLLSDIRDVFDTGEMFTSTLLERLHTLDESPWGESGGAAEPLSATVAGGHCCVRTGSSRRQRSGRWRTGEGVLPRRLRRRLGPLPDRR